MIRNFVIASDVFKAIYNTHTSQGILTKWKLIENNKLYYIKTGSYRYGDFSSLEPISEAIASDIAKLMNLNHVDYTLCNVSTEVDGENKKALSTICEDFIGIGETYTTIYKIFRTLKVEDYYNYLLEKFPNIEDDLNRMIIFDFIINNTDRHLNNFGLIEKDNDYRLMPIYDNGSSLYSDLTTEELNYITTYIYGGKKYDKSMPFRTKHYNQIKLIKNLPKINLNFENNEILDIVDYYTKLYPDNISLMRNNAIKILLKERIEHVRKLYSNV